MNRFDGGVFLENIEWFDESGEELVRRLPVDGSGEIKFGAQLTVRESQAAVLFYQGKACDCFAPGRYTLKTWNLPLVTKLLSIPWRGDSPLRAEVYFVNMKYFPNLKWGTQNPVAFRDSELGLIRLRAHGIFNVQIVQPVLFINTLVGTMGKFTSSNIADYLKLVIVSRLNDCLGDSLDTIFNLPGNFDQVSNELGEILAKDFLQFGLSLSHIYITSITPPDEVQRAIDDQGKMNLISDMEKFMKLKAATAIEKAAESQAGAGTGIGMGLGMMLPAFFGGSLNSLQTGKEQAGNGCAVCPDCSNEIAKEAKFCPICGHQQLLLLQCSKCGKNLTPKAKFCSQCGQDASIRRETIACKKCNAVNLPDARFCNQCGLNLS